MFQNHNMEGSMTMQPAVETVRADGAVLLDIGAGLTEQQWQAPSGCPGWRVQDVVTHMANLFWMLVDPAKLPPADGVPTEQAKEAAGPALEQLTRLEKIDMAVPLGDLGTYPAALLPAAYSFDHYTHIRADLYGPRGPLRGAPPPSDAERLAP